MKAYLTRRQTEMMWKIMEATEYKGQIYYAHDSKVVLEISKWLWSIYKETECENIFSWLIDHKITGLKFLEWVHIDCGGNIHRGIRFILKEKTGEVRLENILQKSLMN